MAKTKHDKNDLDSYTIKDTNMVVKVGDCVLITASDVKNNKTPYVARIEKIGSDSMNNVQVKLRWYYRPADSMGRSRSFHGAKGLFLSDHYSRESANAIEGICIVHSLTDYMKLDNIGQEDFFCRFEYNAATGALTPDAIQVYCRCELPINPDQFMLQCEGCRDRFHPSCIGISIEAVKKLDHFLCSECQKIDPK